MKLFILLLAAITFSSACDNRQQKLRKKENELQQKEQELLLMEKELQLKEQELAKSGKTATSNSIPADTAAKNTNIPGTWAVKMVCIETDCEGSAIGDTKNEHWDIAYKSNTILAQAKADNKLVRVYSGKQNGKIFELSAAQTAADNAPEAKMFVKLKFLAPNRMEGRREIFREGCRIIYSLELTK